MEVGLSFLLQSEEIEQHLDIQAHLHRREVEGLPAGLVVHHPEIQFAVPDPAVHPVHLAAQTQLAVGLRNHHRRQISPVTEGELKGQGHEIRMAQLPGNLVDDGIGRPAQPGEEVAEPGIAVPEVVQLPLHILLDIPAHQGVESLVLHRGKAALFQHVPGDMLEQIVEEGADLRRIKSRRFPGLCPQAILHEIGKVAAAQPLQPGG